MHIGGGRVRRVVFMLFFTQGRIPRHRQTRTTPGEDPREDVGVAVSSNAA